jgi:hypothetical protein
MLSFYCQILTHNLIIIPRACIGFLRAIVPESRLLNFGAPRLCARVPHYYSFVIRPRISPPLAPPATSRLNSGTAFSISVTSTSAKAISRTSLSLLGGDDAGQPPRSFVICPRKLPKTASPTGPSNPVIKLALIGVPVLASYVPIVLALKLATKMVLPKNARPLGPFSELMKFALIVAPVSALYSPTVPLPAFVEATNRVLPKTATTTGWFNPVMKLALIALKVLA